tara:strand:+ start:1352 stop:1915 length:564 start_codon:yes stop_codon:yes gene_type:complete
MKYLLTLFLIFIFNIEADFQTIKEYELCDTILEKEFKATTINKVTWEIKPFVVYQIHNDAIDIVFEDIGTYVLVAKFDNGYCTREDKVIIKVIECTETFIWVPNSFTPNGDNKNEEFGAYGINVKNYKLEIWNRLGENLFNSTDINKRWNGYYGNRMCQEDVYIYKVSYRDMRNNYHELINKITLIH